MRTTNLKTKSDIIKDAVHGWLTKEGSKIPLRNHIDSLSGLSRFLNKKQPPEFTDKEIAELEKQYSKQAA
ncbi:MAG: hypothetical protein KZQ83_00550 [gamma proteobacterium symbiont of Taylorina sp.]|nr:hypothetical protein [gamma proteobacterium symbiont of Taylorina sp.]